MIPNVSYDQALRKLFWQVIVENEHGLGGEESSFEFKYIPDLSKSTQIDAPPESGLRQSGIERRNLQTLIVACIILLVGGYYGTKILCSLVGRMVGF